MTGKIAATLQPLQPNLKKLQLARGRAVAHSQGGADHQDPFDFNPDVRIKLSRHDFLPRLAT